jgi:hypothetical protein
MKPTKALEFDEIKSSKGIRFNYDQGTLVEESDDAHLISLKEAYSSGNVYIEIVLETEPLSNGIIFGVSNANLPQTTNLEKSHCFWGYSCSSSEGYNFRIAPAKDKNNSVDYNYEGVAMKDKLGMMLEFSKEGATITYYLNQVMW